MLYTYIYIIAKLRFKYDYTKEMSSQKFAATIFSNKITLFFSKYNIY